jgi:hypothetical protein
MESPERSAGRLWLIQVGAFGERTARQLRWTDFQGGTCGARISRY